MERLKFPPVLLCQSLHNKVCYGAWCENGKNKYGIPCIPITSLLVVPLRELSKLRNIQ